MGRGYLGEFEQMLLLAILRTGDDAYALEIRRELQERAGRRVSRGAFYTTLDRMQAKGYLRWTTRPISDAATLPGHRGRSRAATGHAWRSPTSGTASTATWHARGGRPQRHFQVTEAGLEQLRRARLALTNLWDGLDRYLARP